MTTLEYVKPLLPKHHCSLPPLPSTPSLLPTTPPLNTITAPYHPSPQHHHCSLPPLPSTPSLLPTTPPLNTITAPYHPSPHHHHCFLPPLPSPPPMPPYHPSPHHSPISQSIEVCSLSRCSFFKPRYRGRCFFCAKYIRTFFCNMTAFAFRY